MKINVTEEGRKGIYIPEKESLIDYIKFKKFEMIHNFIPSGFMMMGADHNVDGVIQDIEDSERLAIFTDHSANMGHSLAIIKDNKLECYDIGKITNDNLIIK